MSPPNDESPSVRGKGIQETHETTNVAIVSDADLERNRFGTLKAAAERAGHHAQRLGSGYLVSRWGHVKHFIDLDGVAAFLRQVGALK